VQVEHRLNPRGLHTRTPRACFQRLKVRLNLKSVFKLCCFRLCAGAPLQPSACPTSSGRGRGGNYRRQLRCCRCRGCRCRRRASFGFVIDGFPAAAVEAMALERALTGRALHWSHFQLPPELIYHRFVTETTQRIPLVEFELNMRAGCVGRREGVVGDGGGRREVGEEGCGPWVGRVLVVPSRPRDCPTLSDGKLSRQTTPPPRDGVWGWTQRGTWEGGESKHILSG